MEPIQLMNLKNTVQNILESEGMKPETAAYIGSIASAVSAAICHEHHHFGNGVVGYGVLERKTISPVPVSPEMGVDLNYHTTSEVPAPIFGQAIPSLSEEYDNDRNNLYTIQIEEIVSQIDLAQVQITKDQEEIESLAKKTDELLNQLDSQVG
ncbi:MAG: hypothetical protein AAGF26_16630 [Cyanobacteria bacterium P01_G01_bin.49]